MNTAFLDAQNLAWKIHAVESGFANRSILKSYESERKLIAESLLNFDAAYSKLFSQRLPSAGEVRTANADSPVEETEFVKTFKASCEFTSGYGVAYIENVFNWSPSHPAKSDLFLSEAQGTTKLRTGRILTNANVTRVADANRVHLEQEIPLNGSFRIYVFGGKPSINMRAINDFASNLTKPGCFYTAYLYKDLESISYHEKHNPHSAYFTLATILNAKRPDIEPEKLLPHVLARYRPHIYADDIWDANLPDAQAAAHAKMGFDQDRGAVVVVRPDGYVGCVVSLIEGSGTIDALNDYFGSFVSKPLGRSIRKDTGIEGRARL